MSAASRNVTLLQLAKRQLQSAQAQWFNATHNQLVNAARRIDIDRSQARDLLPILKVELQTRRHASPDNASDLCPFVLDTKTQCECGTCTITIEVGGAPALAPIWLLVNLLPDVCGPADPSWPPSFPTRCFPDLYPFLGSPVFLGNASARGCAVFSFTKPNLCGWHISVQGYSFGGGPVLSTPVVLDG